jgi:N4-gp56 family major capsid protein
MAATTKTQIPNINSFYDRTFIERLLPTLLFSRFGQARNIPKNSSDVIKFRKYNALSAATTALTEGETPAGSQLSVTDVNATALQYGDFVSLTDKLEMETEDPVETEAAQVLGEQAAETIDTLTRDVVSAGTNVQYASTATQRTDITAAMKLTASEIREAVLTLNKNKARKILDMVNAQVGYNTTPVDSCFVAITTAQGAYDIKSDSAFVPVEKYVGGLKNGALPGEIGKVDDVRVLMTTQGKTFVNGGSSNADVHATIVMGANAYGVTRIDGENEQRIIRKQLGSSGTADPLNQRSTIGWKVSYVVKRLIEDAIVRIEHGVSVE